MENGDVTVQGGSPIRRTYVAKLCVADPVSKQENPGVCYNFPVYAVGPLRMTL